MTHDTLDNSLDLKKLAARLWTTKHWMISAAVLGILCALLYSKFSEQRWHSVARLEPPSLSQVFDYYQALQQLQILTATQTALPLDADKLTSQVYQLFILNLQSEDTQKAFWSQSNLPRRFQLANPANNQWSTALNRIGYIPADLNKSTHDSVQLQADTPEITLQLLQQYLQFVAAKTLNELNRDLQSKWQLALNGLHTQIQLQQTILRLKQPDGKTERYKARIPMHALKTEPYSGTNQQAILATPASRNSPATSDAALQRASELTTLRARIGLISAQTPSFLSFPCWRFIQTPVRPVNSDNPPLFILGLMWGLAAALLAAVIILLPQPPASQVGVE